MMGHLHCTAGVFCHIQCAAGIAKAKSGFKLHVLYVASRSGTWCFCHRISQLAGCNKTDYCLLLPCPDEDSTSQHCNQDFTEAAMPSGA